MLRSLFAGISGLRTNQSMLDVTGNNIANANTVGFKSSSTVFSDTLSQMLTSASAAGDAEGQGGTNPIQVGLGVQLAAVTTNFGQGAAQTTGRPTDLMIQGDGFFVVRDGEEDVYTRAGAFSFDANGFLVTPTGNRVQGYEGAATDGGGTLEDIQLNTDEFVSYSIGPDGVLSGVTPEGENTPIATLAIANFVNPAGLEKIGDTSYRGTVNSGDVELGVARGEGNGTVLSGAVEMSNVDLAAEFTNLILAQRGFQASSRVITTSDQVLEELVNIKR
ncbi:flagellar hook-basal body complex protein [Nocardioides ferulae]|uniref:flagellar hook-basal body complex protein n=1 Tax=Nocardioides ferulae TaxID=2340821 RepID=UPI000EB35C29|nr:flagellar hook-basal body complex protein [Nocardioides ferulae]